MFYLTSALIGRILLRQPAWRWPLVFERPWISTSLADLWSFRWHQTFRYMFVELGSRPGGAKLASGRLGAFALSGAALHDFGMWGDSEREWSPACYRILSPHERRYRLGVLLFVLACKLTQSCKIAFLASFRRAFALGLFVLSLCHVSLCSPRFQNGISLIRSCATGQSLVLITSDKYKHEAQELCTAQNPVLFRGHNRNI